MDNQPGRLSKFFDDPDWHLVIEMLSRNADGMKDIGTIDLNQSAETIKAIVAGRQETLKLLDNFKQDVQSYTKTTNNKPISFK